MRIFIAVLIFSVTYMSNAILSAENQNVIFSENFVGSPRQDVKTENGRSYMSGTEFDINGAYNGCRYWGDVELGFSMRFPKQFPKHFCVSGKDGGWREKTKFMLYYITFTADGLSFYAHGLEKGVPEKKGSFKFKDSGFEDLKPDIWYRFVIRCEKDRLKISIGKEPGKLKQVCDAEVLPGGGGVRIFSYDRSRKVCENPFDLANVEVVELAPAPKPQSN